MGARRLLLVTVVLAGCSGQVDHDTDAAIDDTIPVVTSPVPPATTATTQASVAEPVRRALQGSVREHLGAVESALDVPIEVAILVTGGDEVPSSYEGLTVDLYWSTGWYTSVERPPGAAQLEPVSTVYVAFDGEGSTLFGGTTDLDVAAVLASAGPPYLLRVASRKNFQRLGIQMS